MTNTTKNVIAGVLAVCAILGALAWFGVTPFRQVVQQATQQLGSVVQDNTPWFTNGYKYGNSNRLFSQATLTIAAGTDQAVWKNTTGQAVFVTMTDVYLTGTRDTSQASSTYSIAVGATTTAVIPEPYKFNWETSSTTSDFPDLSITNLNMATGTPAGIPTTGLLFALIGDNILYHASSTNDGVTLIVPPNAYIFAKLDTNCVTQGACDTSTSTTRGFTTVSVPMQYYYSSPN